MHGEASCRRSVPAQTLRFSCLRKEGVACLGALGEPFGVCGVLLNRYWVARGQCAQTVAGTLLWMWWRAEPPRISVLWLA